MLRMKDFNSTILNIKAMALHGTFIFVETAVAAIFNNTLAPNVLAGNTNPSSPKRENI